MLDDTTIQRTLAAALRTGGDFAEVFVEDKRSSAAMLDDGRVEELSSGRDRGAGIRVVVGETTGFAHTADLSDEGLRSAAEAAAKGKGYSEKLCAKAVSRGRTTQEKADARLARITPPADPQDLAGCDAVIEAVADYLRRDNANLGGPFPTSRASDALVVHAHEVAARFLGGRAEGVAFGQNRTTLNFAPTPAPGRPGPRPGRPRPAGFRSTAPVVGSGRNGRRRFSGRRFSEPSPSSPSSASAG